MLLAFCILISGAMAGYEKLEKGDKNANVLNMQLALKSLGYDLEADGSFGAGTQKAVAQFQADQNLTADGVAGDKTLSRLYSLAPAFEPAGSITSSSSSSSSSSSTGTVPARVQTTGGTLTLRKSQSTSAAALKYIPNLTILAVSEKGSKWCKATYDGATGYVLTSYLNFSVASATVTPKPATNTGSNTVIASARVQTTGGTLTLRKTQSTSASALKYIPNLTLLSVYEKGTKWCKVLYDGAVGYVLTSYLNFSVASATATPTPTPTATVPPSVSGLSATVKTSGGTLTLRKSQSTSAAALKYIPNKTVISVLATGDKWCQAVYDGATGYVLTSYLVFSGASVTQAPDTNVYTAYVKTSGGSLNLRESASTGARVLTEIPYGTLVAVTSKGTQWCRVVYGGYTGYVMTDYLSFDTAAQTPGAATATPTPTPTPTPSPTPESAYDTSIFTRVLRSGYTGRDVTLTQQRLQELSYLSSVSNVYDETTIAAVKQFQKLHNLTSDGLAGSSTFTILFSDSAMPYSGDLDSYEALHIYYGTVNTSQTAAVTKLQGALRDLGYSVSVTGKFDENTHNAVVQFQMRNNLTTDGVAGPSTQYLLYSGKAKGYSATPSLVLSDTDGMISGPSKSEIQLLHWYNVVKPALSGGSKLLIYDPNTGLSWTLRVYARGHHADSEPLTLKDTLIMNKAFGKTGWTVHAVYVQLPDGRWTMATMHNRPHLSGSISSNGFDGHLCVHFLRDMDECKKNDPNYGVSNQTTLRAAWKSLTGETVD